MTHGWIDIIEDGVKRRVALRPGLTCLGGGEGAAPVGGVGSDQLHVWSNPPKVLFVGHGTPPLLDGRVFDEAPLSDGASLQWGGAILVYRAERPAVLEELPAGAGRAPASSVAGPASNPRAEVAARRVLAGLLAEAALADRRVVKRWQDAVLRGEYEADASARELLDAAACPMDDPRLLERAGRLQRDLLMAPFQRGVRGAGRSARVAARRGAAFFVANLIAISVYTLILVAIMLLVRIKYGVSFDGLFDRFLELFSSSAGGT